MFEITFYPGTQEAFEKIHADHWFQKDSWIQFTEKDTFVSAFKTERVLSIKRIEDHCCSH